MVKDVNATILSLVDMALIYFMLTSDNALGISVGMLQGALMVWAWVRAGFYIRQHGTDAILRNTAEELAAKIVTEGNSRLYLAVDTILHWISAILLAYCALFAVPGLVLPGVIFTTCLGVAAFFDIKEKVNDHVQK